MQVFADDGARIDAHVSGSERERAVVLIHGFPFSHDIWEKQIEALAQSSYVLAPDLRGAESSSSPEGPYLMERLAADVATLLDAAGIERAAFVGHSMGGYVALAFARMFTERVTRIALVASRLRADTDDEAARRRDIADRIELEGSVEPAIEAYLPRIFTPQSFAERPAVVERAYAIARRNGAIGAAAALRGMALRSASDDIAEDLGVPALVIAGGCDGVISIEEARAVAARFPHGRLVLCDASGHLPMMEEPDCVSEALAAWLNE